MTPERAAAILRELLQTPPQELAHFGRRNGLEGQPSPPDLAQAQELLQAICVALASDPGPNWERVHTAFGAMRARHGELRLDARGPQAPPWIQNVPARPSLGDPAPGTADHRMREAQRERFVPAAPDRSAPSPPLGPAGYAAPQPPAGYPAPQAGYPAPQAGYPAPQAGYPAPQPHAGHPPSHHGHAQHPGHAAHAAHAAHQGYPAPQPHAAPSAGYPPAAPPAAPRRDDRGIATSVATYAAFCAACAAQPERVPAIMSEYGVHGDEARTALDEDWQDRFDDNPTLHQQWERLFHQFRGQLRR